MRVGLPDALHVLRRPGRPRQRGEPVAGVEAIRMRWKVSAGTEPRILLPGLGIRSRDSGCRAESRIPIPESWLSSAYARTRSHPSQRADRPHRQRVALANPGVPVPRRVRGRDDGDHRLLPAPRAAPGADVRLRPAADGQLRPAEPGHAGAVPRSRAQALRLAALHDLRADLADVVGRVDSRSGLPGARPGEFAIHPPDPIQGLWPALDRVTERLSVRRTAWWIGAVNVVLGVALGIYTGVLLSALGARPFWSSALLGPLFLLSGLSSAAAFTHLVARHPEERVLLAKSDNVFLSIELFVIGLFLVGLLSSSQGQMDAARLVLGGPFTSAFWVLVVGLGIVVPLGVQVLAVTHRIQHTPVAPIMVMAGGLVLRFVFVMAGQYSRWPGA